MAPSPAFIATEITAFSGTQILSVQASQLAMPVSVRSVPGATLLSTRTSASSA